MPKQRSLLFVFLIITFNDLDEINGTSPQRINILLLFLTVFDLIAILTASAVPQGFFCETVFNLFFLTKSNNSLGESPKTHIISFDEIDFAVL